ncbi:hypothetical protein CDAR_592401 [Caerostris darwini]|uniref:Uncharacterized protein n=1 Tax=Caerostris darwini TaxID=1538125 RepID=A0AAV4TFX1_9ARAC|nr:hypothetical protein CDAR_592401 [Caerostris darwini]
MHFKSTTSRLEVQHIHGKTTEQLSKQSWEADELLLRHAIIQTERLRGSFIKHEINMIANRSLENPGDSSHESGLPHQTSNNNDFISKLSP